MTEIATATIQSADDLRARIRQLAATNPDPARITDQILRSLATEEARVVASVTMYDFVRRLVSSPMPDPTPPREYETQAGAKSPSKKVAALRDWVDRELSVSLCVDDRGHEWKRLADCTADDLTAVAERRAKQAAEVAAQGERFDRIAKAVADAGVETVSALDRATLESVLR